MQNLPLYIYVTFILTVIAAVWFIYKAANHSKPFLTVIILWVIFQSFLGMNGFYKIRTFPPRFLFLVFPPVILLLLSLLIPAGKRFMDRLNVKDLTIFNLIRIPVEIVLYCLFLNNAVPGIMTFEGRNFDILSGVSAPVIWYFGFVKGSLNRTVLIVWNLVCLALLLNVLRIVALSLISKIPAFAFDQSKLVLVYFPFVLLPACLVPLVLLSHVAAIRQLSKRRPALLNGNL
jgi:hypothetical protein